jgi:hypothetical protein
MAYMQDNSAFYTSSEAGSEYDEYFAEDEVVQVIDKVRLTINNQSRRQHKQRVYHAAQ